MFTAHSLSNAIETLAWEIETNGQRSTSLHWAYFGAPNDRAAQRIIGCFFCKGDDRVNQGLSELNGAGLSNDDGEPSEEWEDNWDNYPHKTNFFS